MTKLIDQFVVYSYETEESLSLLLDIIYACRHPASIS